jgi:hypothetical protein
MQVDAVVHEVLSGVAVDCRETEQQRGAALDRKTPLENSKVAGDSDATTRQPRIRTVVQADSAVASDVRVTRCIHVA